MSHAELDAGAQRWAQKLRSPKSLCLVYIHNRIADVEAMLGALMAGHAVALCDPALPVPARAAFHDIYRPEWVIADGEASRAAEPHGGDIHPDLALLLSTSGSTGSAKLVRLTVSALRANARAIGEVLRIEPSGVASGHLPLHYSFGLSVLTSHLTRGASIRLTAHGLTQRPFWSVMRDAGVSQLPGVPLHFQMFEQLRYERIDLPSLDSLVQAGGTLSVASRQRAHQYMTARGGRFYVMYGQTEAAPRMTTLDHDDFPLAPASVGRALPSGRIVIELAGEGREGEVLYEGPNVMMGYSERRSDLAQGDQLRGALRTGDIGFLDEAGRLTLTGRTKRMGKLHGLRINLDELERRASELVPTVLVQRGEKLCLYFVAQGDPAAPIAALLEQMTRYSTVPRTSWQIRPISEIPRTDRGKIDYRALEELA